MNTIMMELLNIVLELKYKMNTNELILKLQYADDLQVVIPVYRVGAVGGTSYVNVKSVTTGFDWDAGRIFLNTEERLREIDRDEIKTLQDKYDELGWKHYEISNLKRENKKLKERIKELESKYESKD
jgi:hypothetical protein